MARCIVGWKVVGHGLFNVRLFRIVHLAVLVELLVDVLWRIRLACQVNVHALLDRPRQISKGLLFSFTDFLC